MKKKRPLICLLWILFGLTLGLPCQTVTPHTGVIQGTVRDADSHLALAGALVEIVALSRQITTDELGRFSFPHLLEGVYVLRASQKNYETTNKANVVCKPGRNTVVDFLLPLHLQDEVTISAGNFPSASNNEVSQSSFSSAEIRGNAGAAGDISRVLSILPSVSRINDMVNALAVRGGSPGENAFYIDNIPVPDINHYPTPGSTGGPIGMLNVDFIDNVTLYAGGFPVQYGDRLSSVMDISFGQGSREKTQMKASFDFAGFGWVGEGPLFKKKGSWLLSLRRSFIDLALKLIGEESGIAPRYSDIQGKLVVDLSAKHQLTLLTLIGIDWVGWQKERAQGIGNNFYGDNQGKQLTLGLNWRWLWASGSSDTTLACSYADNLADYKHVRDDSSFMANDSSDFSLTLRNQNNWLISNHWQLQFGFDLQQSRNRFNYFLRAYTDFWGRLHPASWFNGQARRNQAGLFANLTHASGPVTVQLGTRVDNDFLSAKQTISPRLSISAKLFKRTTITAAIGWVNQNLPLLLVNQCPAAQQFGAMKARHIILGISQLLTDDLRLTLEAYDKEYANLPIDPDQPLFFFIDELVYGGAYFPRAELATTGRARSWGIEFSLQKKLASTIYGMISGSLFRSRYQDGLGNWRDRVFDVQYLLGLEGGFRPNKRWSFALRWSFCGGAPYTPFDLGLSIPANAGIFDQMAINSARNPALHSLNLRVDHHFIFKQSSLSVYLDLWNVYNRKNAGFRYWNSTKRQEDTMRSWGILPILGLEYEF